MNFNVDAHLPEGLRVHPAAAALFNERTSLLFIPALGPLSSDVGSSAMHDYALWREDNPTATLSDYANWICESFDVEHSPDLATDAAIEEQLALADVREIDFMEKVYAVDETLIAGALAQLIFEGGVDQNGRRSIALAIRRQAHRLVLERIWPEAGSRSVRVAVLMEVGRLLEMAGDRPPVTPTVS